MTNFWKEQGNWKQITWVNILQIFEHVAFTYHGIDLWVNIKQCWTGDKSAAAINNYRYIPIKKLHPIYLPSFTLLLHLFLQRIVFLPTVFTIWYYFCYHVYYFVNCA